MAARLTPTPTPASRDGAALAAEAYRVVVVEPERARSLAAAALRLAGRPADPATTSAAHRALGMAALELDDASTAVSHFERAVRAGRRADPQREAEARMSLALALLGSGATGRALRQSELAVGITGVSEPGPLQLQRAMILERLGRLTESLEGYRLALAGFRRSGDRNGEARALCDRGVLQTYRGALGPAEADLRRAERICEELGLGSMAAGVRQNLGFLAAQRGDVPAALECYEQVQEPLERIGGTRYALLELDRCQLLLSVGLVREARESATRAIGALESTEMDAEVAEAWLQRAEVALAEGEWATARRAGEQALTALTRQRRPTWASLARFVAVRARWRADGSSEALHRAARRAAVELDRSGWTPQALDARLLAARIALDLGRPRAARRDLEVAARARLRGPAAVRVAGWHAEALRCLTLGRPQAAGRAVGRGLRALDEHRAALGATELRALAAARGDELACLGVDFAIATGRPARVLAAVERARARSLHLPPVRPPADPALAARLGELRAVSALAAEEVRAGRSIAGLVRRQTALEHQIRRRLLQVPGTGHLRPAKPASVGALRRVLGERALVEYLSDAGDLHAVVVTADRSRLVALGDASEAEKELHLLRFAMRRLAAPSPASRLPSVHGENARHAARRLQALLLDPLRDAVGDRELVLVPTGALHALPWGALPACAGRPVSVAPSAALWLKAAERAASPVGGRALLVAGPGLAHAEHEVRALAELYDDPVVLTGGDARVEAVAAALALSDRAHLACHGSFRADNPQFSALMLADGPLAVHDIESLADAPRQLILSACDSGRAVVQAGDELMGLTSALLAIGAVTVVASTVAVPDAPTRSFMLELHRGLEAGARPAPALAGARVAAAGHGDAGQVARDAFVCLGAG